MDPHELSQVIAERLRACRRRSGWSQHQSARAAGVPDGTIIRWEGGKNLPSIDRLLVLAQAFPCSMDYLTGRVDEFEARTQLDRGAILVDEAAVRRIITARSAADLDPLIVDPGPQWGYVIPQEFSVLRPEEYAERQRTIEDALEPLRPALSKRWKARKLT